VGAAAGGRRRGVAEDDAGVTGSLLATARVNNTRQSEGGREGGRERLHVNKRGGSVIQGWSVNLGVVSVLRRQNLAGGGAVSMTGASMGLCVTCKGRGQKTGFEATPRRSWGLWRHE
jgi:hypothetical protein